MAAITQIGLTVPDIDKAVDWYSKVLDFKVIVAPYDTIEKKQLTDLSRDLYGAPFRRARLAQLNDPNKIGIELFEFEQTPSPADANSRPGLFHLCVTSQDQQALADKIVRNGGKRRNISGLHSLIYCEDPFGNVIEVYPEQTNSAIFEQSQ
ncbi:VOC family protein [Sediminibacillus massiliensis]|uniref:VOC family protein n=1 Tax=Sediminibacillus massiliensis TaxID=1926277 RepID=UPI0009884728|nr:VOC family protein [Sediminibacillus massiliensis]